MLILAFTLAVAGVTVALTQAPGTTVHVTVLKVVRRAPKTTTIHIAEDHTNAPTSATPTGAAPTSARPQASAPAGASSGASLYAAATTTGATAMFKAGAGASFAHFQATQPGHIELAAAPLGGGPSASLGGNLPAHGWSTTKVPVLVALLRARGTAGLTAEEQQWAEAAITQSDNQSILDIFGDIEQLKGGLLGASNYVQSVLRASGDSETVVATAHPPPGAVTTFGQTEWAPSEAVKFFSELGRGCLLPSKQSNYVLGLMQNIEPSESWGLGSADFGMAVAFKGGWGPEPTGSYLVRQSGIIDVGSSRGIVVSIVALPSGSGAASFGAGTQMLTATAQWLRSELVFAAHPKYVCSVP